MPSTPELWKNKSCPGAVSMKPKPLSVSLLIEPSAIFLPIQNVTMMRCPTRLVQASSRIRETLADGNAETIEAGLMPFTIRNRVLKSGFGRAFSGLRLITVDPACVLRRFNLRRVSLAEQFPRSQWATMPQ